MQCNLEMPNRWKVRKHELHVSCCVPFSHSSAYHSCAGVKAVLLLLLLQRLLLQTTQAKRTAGAY
jgi:hypothetical protein